MTNELLLALATQAVIASKNRYGWGTHNAWNDNQAVADALDCEGLGWWDEDQNELTRIWEQEQTGLDPPALAALHIEALRRQGYLD